MYQIYIKLMIIKNKLIYIVKMDFHHKYGVHNYGIIYIL